MIKKDIKLFATDLDGTLFARPAHLTQYATETLRMLRAQHVLQSVLAVITSVFLMAFQMISMTISFPTMAKTFTL